MARADAPADGGAGGFLDLVERVGNKVPHPAILFLWLCIGVIVLSQLLAWAGVGATYEVVKPDPQSDGDPRVQGTLNQLFRAQANLQTTDSLKFDIAAKVASVLPNGTLVPPPPSTPCSSAGTVVFWAKQATAERAIAATIARRIIRLPPARHRPSSAPGGAPSPA